MRMLLLVIISEFLEGRSEYSPEIWRIICTEYVVTEIL